MLPIVCAETPDLSSVPAINVIENCDRPLVDPQKIEDDSPENMMRQLMQRTDTIILVCYFERVFTPLYREYRNHNRKRHGGQKIVREYNGLFMMEKHGRVVQSLMGNIKVGSEFVLREVYDEIPPTATFSREDLMQGKVTQPLTVPMRGEMSYIVFHSKDMEIANGVIFHENRNVDSEYRCSSEYRTSLSKYLRIRPAAIEKNVFEN